MPSKTELLDLGKATWAQFTKDNCMYLAAALAYYAAFAIAPLIIVLVEIAGLLVGNHRRALNLIFGYLQHDAGSGANAVRQIVASTFNEPRSGVLAEIIGWVVFVVAAVGLFSALQGALNIVWEVKPPQQGIWLTIKERALAFLTVMAAGALLLISMAANALLTMASAYFTHLFPGAATIFKIADFALSFALVWAICAFVFAYLPQRHIAWKDVQLGAAFTAFLWVIGQFLLGWYLGRAGVSSGYGAFGSLVVFLIWVNYSAQIFLLGAEFTYVYANRKSAAAPA